MISILAGFGYFACLFWLYRRYPWALLTSAFLVFTFTLRTICAIYVDVAGPVFATELGYDVGPGSSAPLLVTSVLLVLGTIVFFLSRIRVESLPIGRTFLGFPHRRISDLVFTAAVVWVSLLFGELLLSGHVPLLEGMDRIEYQQQFGGAFYDLGYSFAFLFASICGFFFMYSRFLDGRYDYRFAYLIGYFLLFFILTGNRFSIFYLVLSYLLMPLSAIVMMHLRRVGLPPFRWSGRVHAFVTSRDGAVLTLLFATAVFGGVLLHNFFGVRYTEYNGEAQEAVLQRTLIQPIELYSVTWDRIVTGELSDTNLVWDVMFNNPIDAKRNTGIQYLMVAALGEQRATEIIDENSTFAGGYPEVFIELFGLMLAPIMMFAAAVAVAFMYREIVIAAGCGRAATFLLGIYVLFGINLIYIGGMLNFVLPWTFWAKVGAFTIARIFEPRVMWRPKMEDWRKYYNEERPHSVIGNQAPIMQLNQDGTAGPPS